MSESESWSLEGIDRGGEVVVEILAGVDGRALSIDTPGWSLVLRLPVARLGEVAEFLRAHAGRAEFAECVAGLFLGRPVRLINDNEFSDRMWLRVGGGGEVANFPLIGETASSFVAAVFHLAESAEHRT